MAKSFLDTLLGDHSLPVEEVLVHKVTRSPHQPREKFDEEALGSLAASIQEVGLINPIVVREKSSGYELVAGERRLRAHQLLGKKRIPAYVRTLNEATAIEVALIENIQRENLTPMEEARAINRLKSLQHLSQTEAAQKVGRSAKQVALLLKLLSLDPAVQDLVHQGTLSPTVARVLADIAEADAQKAWAKRAVEKSLSADQLTALLQAPAAPNAHLATVTKDHAAWLSNLKSLKTTLGKLKKLGNGATHVEERDLGDTVEYVIRVPKNGAAEAPAPKVYNGAA